MTSNHESLHDRTLANENLAGPEPHLSAGSNGHHNIRNSTLNNENLTAPTPRLDDVPLEKDFSRNGTAPGLSNSTRSI